MTIESQNFSWGDSPKIWVGEHNLVIRSINHHFFLDTALISPMPVSVSNILNTYSRSVQCNIEDDGIDTDLVILETAVGEVESDTNHIVIVVEGKDWLNIVNTVFSIQAFADNAEIRHIMNTKKGSISVEDWVVLLL